MKVIIIGRERTVQKLTAVLAGEDIDIVRLSDGLDKVVALQHQEMFDLAIVDSLAEEVETACHHINKVWGIPLVLVVSKRHTDWAQLQLLGAIGYLPVEAENGELLVRLRAMLRRFFPSLKLSMAEAWVRVAECPIWQERCHPSCYWRKGSRCYYKSNRGRMIRAVAMR